MTDRVRTTLGFLLIDLQDRLDPNSDEAIAARKRRAIQREQSRASSQRRRDRREAEGRS